MMKLNNSFRLIVSIFLFTLISISISLLINYQYLIEDFKSDVENVDVRFTQQMASMETVLISLTGLHHASDNLNQVELSVFSEEMLKAYPYIDAIIGMEKLKKKEVNEFEKRMNKLGYIGLKVKRSEVSESTFYMPANFTEPMTPISASIIGVDFRSFPEFLEAIDLAIDSGKVSASKVTTTPNMKSPSVLMFKAIYLGRYPPETTMDRSIMLNGMVALKIDINNFINYLELEKLNLVGNIYNAVLDGSVDKNTTIKMFDFSYNIFSFSENIKIYDKSYRLVLERRVSFYTIGKQQAIFTWFLSMSFLVVVIYFLKKRKESEDEIKHLAYFDSLTDLPNRESFKEKLNAALKQSLKNTTSGAVLFMDIDEFKRINDTLGHDVGDELLKQVSNRLTYFMRQSDVVSLDLQIKSNDVVTRLGGDEFTVLLTNIKNSESVGVIADRIQKRISQPFNLNGHEVFVTSSIGVAVFPDDGEDVDQILKCADMAMYYAKEMGKNNFQFYFEKMSSKIERRLKLEGRLHQALKNDEFLLYYQPQIDVKTNKIVAAEALIRWNQKDLGLVFPDDFIPLAEETGQIFDIGEWVVKEACRQNRAWQTAGYNAIRVAVNLSSLQFMQNNLSDIISSVLQETELDPQYLELEITESIMMKNIDETTGIIQKFKDMNVGVSVDDFGTGYSSLSYLKKFPIDSLKIDKSFVMDIPEDKDDMMITSAIISMAKSLNLKVIAEGVESQGQVDFLTQQKCDLMQGYHFSRPVPAAEFEKMLEKG